MKIRSTVLVAAGIAIMSLFSLNVAMANTPDHYRTINIVFHNQSNQVIYPGVDFKSFTTVYTGSSNRHCVVNIGGANLKRSPSLAPNKSMNAAYLFKSDNESVKCDGTSDLPDSGTLKFKVMGSTSSHSGPSETLASVTATYLHFSNDSRPIVTAHTYGYENGLNSNAVYIGHTLTITVTNL